MKELLADVLLYAILLAAGAVAGITYESANNANAAKAELQDLQNRAARTTAWLRDAKASSEGALNQTIAELQAKLSTDQGRANEDHQTHVAGVRAGTVSVRVPIVPASCPSHSVGAANRAALATEPAYAQLDPAAAADLAAIPHEGDAAIRELNTCIAQYHRVKDALDAWHQQLTQLELGHAQTP